MLIQDTKLPLEGDVPSEEGEFPETSSSISGASETSLRDIRQMNNTTTPASTPSLSFTNSSPSRTLSSRKKLLCRCPWPNCGREHRSSTSSQYGRNKSQINLNQTSPAMNIPLEKEEASKMDKPYNSIPHPAYVSGAAAPGWTHPAYVSGSAAPGWTHPAYVSGSAEPGWTHPAYVQGYAVSGWQSNLGSDNQDIYSNLNQYNYNISSRRELLARGVGNPLLQDPTSLHSLQQQQQQQKILQVPVTYRKRAINYMMTHLQLIGSENDSALQIVRRRIERIEEQVYEAASDKENYVNLLAIKLGAITERLYSRNRVRSPLGAHAPPPAQPQPTCG